MKTINEVIDFIQERFNPYNDADMVEYGLSDGKLLWELGRKQGYRDILYTLIEQISPNKEEIDVLRPQDRIPADLYGRTGTPSS